MQPRISVIVPNRNGVKTIGRCLAALFGSSHESFEVIVVDDASADGSLEVIERYPCRLHRLAQHAGAAAARNKGAALSRGRLLFFTDADCLVLPDTVALAEQAFLRNEGRAVIGGTYTLEAADSGFFCRFQSVFIHYAETKSSSHPDYLASHALVIGADLFRDSGGFREDFFPILEDVEYSHRLRRQGVRLLVRPEIMVRHIFGYSLCGSLRNGFRKAKYWTLYSLGNRDLLTDSGTASVELKINVLAWLSMAALTVLSTLWPGAFPAWIPAFPGLVNLAVNRRLLRLYRQTGGTGFAMLSSGYYLLLYPLAVGLGGLGGLAGYLLTRSGRSVTATKI